VAAKRVQTRTSDRSSTKKATAKAAVGALKKANAFDKFVIPPNNDYDTTAHKFAQSGQTPPPDHQSEPIFIEENLGELPDSYGTKKLFLASRDPYWVFAYWDLNTDQYREFVGRAHDGKVFLKIYEISGNLLTQNQIHEGLRNHYFHAQRPNTTFYAELGYYRQGDHMFEVISRSGYTTTPRDNVSPNTRVRFATIPMHFTFRQLMDLVKGLIEQDEELADAIARLQETGYPFPFRAQVLAGQWSPEQEQALVGLLGNDLMRKVWMGSFEITEWLRKRILTETSSGLNMSSWSSPMGASFGAPTDRNFWMNVNAELIIYGATDPKAQLRIAGKDIDIRKDGTFSFHWSFPEGQYHIPVEATSPDKVETRSALLSFLRMTDLSGDVGTHPQDPNFEKPVGKLA